VKDALQGTETQEPSLANPMPVFLFYWTAFAEEIGNINFREDSYGWEAEMIRALVRPLYARLQICKAQTYFLGHMTSLDPDD
jgi:murein L,D-transpeptidase YcbB/YkuD